MPIVTLFSGAFCKDKKVIRESLKRIEYRLVTDHEIVTRASVLSKMPVDKIERAFSAKTRVFNEFAHERERSIAHLRLAVAEIIRKENIFIAGFSGQLIPKDIHHIIRICLIADPKVRIDSAKRRYQLSDQESLRLIQQDDEDRTCWIQKIFSKRDPWDPTLYHLLFPIDKYSPEEIAEVIEIKVREKEFQPSSRSQKKTADFLTAARVESALVNEGHIVGINVKSGIVTLTINQHVLMLSRLEEEIKIIAGKVSGVKKVNTETALTYDPSENITSDAFQTRSKILLVDDEIEFVQALSDRLMMRDLESASVYDGESALEIVKNNETDVMILDLKMPGIDGLDVLRRIKQEQPKIEVIILTGHGSESDKETCMKLGAFAFLNKPVNIEMLSGIIKAARKKINDISSAADKL